MNDDERRRIISEHVKDEEETLSTIYRDLRGLDSIPKYLLNLAEININDERKKVFDKHKSNSLLNKAIKQEVSISDIVSGLAKEYKDKIWKFYVSISNDNNKIYEKYTALGLGRILYPAEWIKDEKIVNIFTFIFSNYIQNSTIGGILGLGAGLYLSNLRGNMPILDKVFTVVSFPILGVLFGLMFIEIHNKTKLIDSNIKKDAKYLQNRIDEYIGLQNTREILDRV